MRRRLAAALIVVLAICGAVAMPQSAQADPNFILTPNGVVGVERSWAVWTVSKAFGDPLSSVVVDGELPPGLSLVDFWDDSEFGGLSISLEGTPATAGYYEFTVGILDENDDPVEILGTPTWGITIVPIQQGTTPTFGPVTRLSSGFSATITSHLGGLGISYSIDVVSTDGATDPSSVGVTRVGALIGVAGLEPGESATLEVTAHRYGYTDESAQLTGQALWVGIAPEFGTPQWTNDGFSVVISNWDSDVSYTPTLVSPIGHGAVALADDTITVSGLDPDEEATVSLLVEHPERTDASDSITWAAPPWEDGNIDGVTDYIQPWVVKAHDSSGVKIYLETDLATVCAIDDTQSLSVNDAPHGYLPSSIPLVGFTIVGCGGPGFTTTVAWFFHGVDGAGLVPFKYDETSEAFAGIPGATVQTVDVEAVAVTIVNYAITDGGPLDADGAADGEITDPLGLFGRAAIASTGVDAGPTLAVGLLFSALGLIALGIRGRTDRSPSRG